tara:strand:+ start:289 stop:636 length:348 start_codon:yes stop_codon:yes gene_type:complete
MIIKRLKLNTTLLGQVLTLVALLSTPAQAELDFGFEAEYQGNFEQALAELQPLAEAGDPRAQLWLGLMYYYGRGVPFNPRKAQKWIRKSADQLYENAEFSWCFIIQGCWTGGLVN